MIYLSVKYIEIKSFSFGRKQTEMWNRNRNRKKNVHCVCCEYLLRIASAVDVTYVLTALFD